ncbi:MAG: GGDEF domain-containing protein [Actinomycetota bacterium]
MSEASVGVDEVDLTDPGPEGFESTELTALRRRMAELEVELEQARAEVGRLQLQVDLFTSTDPVTGFVNRTGTIDAIQSSLDRLDRMSEPVTILVLAVPELRELRASLTDADLVGGLRHLGALVAGGLRRVDRVGRLDDDTFVSVLANLGSDSVDIVLARIEDALTAAPVELGGTAHTLRPSVGALVLESSQIGEGGDPDLLLDQAIALLRHATDERTIAIR